MDQAKKLLSVLNVRQLITIAICAIAVAGGVVWFSRYQHESGLRPLYSSLSPEDANAIVQKLRETGVDYKIADNGAAVLVSETRIPELRLEMAGLGLPKTGRIGFEIFDKTNFGMTDFAEHVNYRRAVEGELERSVRALDEVQQARVHVSLPKESVYSESREPAKASVLVGLRPGMHLSAQNVLAIRNLVSSAVEGLTPDAVSVVDMNGNLLSQPRRNSLDEGVQVTEATLEYRQAVEKDLALKINNTLEPLLGADKFRTGVSADVDMTSGEESDETYDPTKSVMVSSQKSEDTSGSTRPGPTPPGTAANLPPSVTAPATTAAATAPQQTASTTTNANPAGTPPASGAGSTPAAEQPKQAAAKPTGTVSNSSRRTESITYQSSRTVKHVKMPQGSIKKLSIAVLVDQGTKMEGQGKQAHRVVLPPDPEKLKAIQSLVGALAGFSAERGDQLTVEALPFDASLNVDMPADTVPAPKKADETLSMETLKKKPAILYGAGGGVVLLLLLAFLAFGRRKSAPEVSVPAALPVAAPPAMLSSATAEIGQPTSRLPALMPTKSELLLAQLQDSAKKDPEAWAGVVRGWLSEERNNA
jgi:flagellar M-ring protein FliF